MAPPSISMPLTNSSVSNFNFMQLSQVPNKTISDKSFSHLSRSDGSLPATHSQRCVIIIAATVQMPLHDFILPKPDTNSIVFDFLVIFCSFYVYSLVPRVWHPIFLVIFCSFCVYSLVPGVWHLMPNIFSKFLCLFSHPRHRFFRFIKGIKPTFFYFFMNFFN